MKKITRFFATMVMLVATMSFSANAQSYFTNYGTFTRGDRHLNTLEIQRDGANYNTLNINQGEGTDKPVYFDKTDACNIIEVAPGGTVKFSPNWTGHWMGVAVLVDWNKDFTFDVDMANGEYVVKNNGDNNGVQPVEFTVPATQGEGEYRLRYMIDWVTDNAADLPHANAADNPTNNLLTANAGVVVDFVLKVTATPKEVIAPPTITGGLEHGAILLTGDDRPVPPATITAQAGALIKYTTDGSDPITSTTAIETTTNTVDVPMTETVKDIKAIAFKGTVTNCATVVSLKAPKRISTALGKEYQIVFQKNGGVSALQEGDPLTLQEYTFMQENQIFVFAKAETVGLYTLTSKAGNIVEFSNGRFRTGTTPAELRIVQFLDTENFVIQRKEKTNQSMNPNGGFVNGKEIAEYSDNDASNEVNFVPVKLKSFENSYVTIGGFKGTWYDCSGVGHPTKFHGANLGEFATVIDLGGEIQAKPEVENGISMFYKIDNGSFVEVPLPKLPVASNSTTPEQDKYKHYGSKQIDISGLSVGTHTIEVYFRGVFGGHESYDNIAPFVNYKATFKKTVSGIDEITLQKNISVNNGIITVSGVENFSVFTVAGQRVDAKRPLQAGIYVVKVDNLVQKVVVK